MNTKCKVYIFGLLLALAGCLYQLHENSLTLQYQRILIRECQALLGAPAQGDPNNRLHNF